MQTKILQPNQEAIQYASRLLQEGELVGMPTETVYGLAANALDVQAVKKIFQAKGRPQDNPLIVHISRLDMLDQLVAKIPPVAKRLSERYWPGPLTMIFPRSEKVPLQVTAGLDTVAVRFPSHLVAQELISDSGLPLAAPSANLSGRPSPTTALHVYQDMNGKIPLILDGGECKVGVESTVVAVKGEDAKLLRPGGVTPEMLRECCGKLEIDDAVYHQLKEGEKAASPGMKYKHYSPKADVIILEGTLEQFKEYLARRKAKGAYALVFDGEEKDLNFPYLTYGATQEEQARELFAALRELDHRGAKTIYARCPEKTGVGLAVYNRLVRAAGFTILKL